MHRLIYSMVFHGCIHLNNKTKDYHKYVPDQTVSLLVFHVERIIPINLCKRKSPLSWNPHKSLYEE